MSDYTDEVHVDVGLPGHVWIEVGSPNGSMEYGYYPEEASPIYPGQVRNDNDPYRDVDWSSETYPITQEQWERLNQWLTEQVANRGWYGVGIKYCVQFVDDALEQIGLPSISNGIFTSPSQVPGTLGDPRWLTLMENIQNNYNQARTPCRTDPLALDLDLDGDGIETITASGYSGAMFDINNDGVKVATGWVKSDDGVLVWDKNHNKMADNGATLCGQNAVSANALLTRA